MIEAVVRAARRDLESETFEATCKKRIEPFNATESAMKHLWSGTLGEESGDSNGAAASSTPFLRACLYNWPTAPPPLFISLGRDGAYNRGTHTKGVRPLPRLMPRPSLQLRSRARFMP